MRLTTVLLIASLLQVSASTFGQRITMNQQNVPLKTLFKEIRKQSGFNFYYDGRIVTPDIKSSINVSNVTVDEALKSVLGNLPYSYQIKDRTVLITKKAEPTLFDNVIARFQTIDIKGKVVDSLGNGLAGATVSVKGGKQSTSTNAGGDFLLKNIDEQSTIVISYLGYVTKQVAVSKDYNYIILQQSSSKLDEVQVIAYGSTTRRLSTGNVTKVTADEIQKQPINNPLLALAGRVPGLTISQSTGFAGSGIKIEIQGQNSMRKGNMPFYIIDGVPFMSESMPNLGDVLKRSESGSGFSNYEAGSSTYGNPLSNINPLDIESIEVLKDADATAIYGSRAANGVILITTKKGKAGRTQVTLNIQSGIGQVGNKLKLLNTEQYVQMRKEAYLNDGQALPQSPSRLNADLTYHDQNRYTDWQEELIGKNANYNDAQFSISNGSSNTQYLVSGNYHNETTVFPTDLGYERGSLRFNLGSVSDNQKFRISLSSNYGIAQNNLPSVDLTSRAMVLAPNAPDIHNVDGSLNWAPLPNGPSSLFGGNPYANFSNLYKSKSADLQATSILSYDILPGLVIKSSLGYNNQIVDEIKTNLKSAGDPYFQNSPWILSSARYGSNNQSLWSIEPQITLKRNFNIGKIEVLLGGSIQQSDSKRKELYGENFQSDLQIENINAAGTVRVENGSTILSRYKYASLFTRLNYNWRDKYILNLSARRDGTSRFGRENRFHNFGSIGAAWVFSEESLFKNNLGFISFGKLKFSYGSVGNDQIGDYAYLSLLSNVSYATPYSGGSGLTINNIANPYLQWELTKKMSTSLDLGLIEDRILINATFFRNRTTNQLLSDGLVPSTGFVLIETNADATVQNSGWEFSLNSLNLKGGKLNWSTNFNISLPKNKLVSAGDDYLFAPGRRQVIGHPLNEVTLYSYKQVNQVTGVYEFIDQQGNLTNNPDEGGSKNQIIRILTGQTLYGGIQNQFSYKHLSLDFLFQFVRQNGKNVNGGFALPGQVGSNQPAGILNRWQQTGDAKDFQKYSTGNNFDMYLSYGSYIASDAVWADASYIRLKNLSISWQLPLSWLDKVKIQNAKISLTGQNLLTFSNYEGLDPESLSSLSLPPLRIFTLGLNLTL